MVDWIQLGYFVQTFICGLAIGIGIGLAINR